MSFDNLKKRAGSSLEAMNKAVEEIKNNNSYDKDKDEFWQPTVDKSGSGSAVIRFLPAPDGEQLPWVMLYNHGFKGPSGRWYIENCLTTLKQDDPVVLHCSRLWNSGLESDKELARDRKRRLSYISNILVIKDPGNPENEGKVFKYRYGKKIFDKIIDVMQPDSNFEDEEPMDPFNFWTGANFKLKIRKVEGYRNYDKSEFDKPSELFDGDEDKLKKLYESEFPLEPIVSEDNFKSFDELARKLSQVLEEPIEDLLGTNVKVKPVESKQEAKSKQSPSIKSSEDEEQLPFDDDDDDEDDVMKKFQALANS